MSTIDEFGNVEGLPDVTLEERMRTLEYWGKVSVLLNVVLYTLCTVLYFVK